MIYPDFLNEKTKNKFQLELILDEQGREKSIYKSKIEILEKLFFICESPFEVEIITYEILNGTKYGFSQKIPTIPFENMNAKNILDILNDEINKVKSNQ